MTRPNFTPPPMPRPGSRWARTYGPLGNRRVKFQRIHPDGRKETVDIDALMRVEESIIERLRATGWFKREDEEELRVLLNEERARERDRKEER